MEIVGAYFLLKEVVQEKEYFHFLPQDAPLGQIHDVFSKGKEFMIQKILQHEELEKAAFAKQFEKKLEIPSELPVGDREEIPCES